MASNVSILKIVTGYISSELASAVNARDVDLINETIDVIHTNGYFGKLQQDVQDAERFVYGLQKIGSSQIQKSSSSFIMVIHVYKEYISLWLILYVLSERLRVAVTDMDKNTMSEIKSYSQPPEIVRKVMVATFLLLGEDEDTTSVIGKNSSLYLCYETHTNDSRRFLYNQISRA